MRFVRAIIAAVSIVALAGALTPSNAFAAQLSSARVSTLSCAAIGWSADKSAVGSPVDLKVMMSPYTATLSAVVQKHGTQTLIHPEDVSIADRGRAVGTSSLLEYSGSSVGSMFVGKYPSSSTSSTPENLCLARFVGARQPAVVVPISGPYIQGNFYSVDIFPLSPDGTMLSPITEDLSVTGGSLTITNDGVLIQSGDSSFIGRFAPFAYSVDPLVLTVPVFGDSTHLLPGHIALVTSQYPSLLRSNAQQLWSEFVDLPADESIDPFGILAAWVADETGLHTQAAAIAKVDSAVTSKHIRFPVYGIKSLKNFNLELRSFLEARGYN